MNISQRIIKRPRRRRGLTLIEVLLVMVILLILGSLVGVAVVQQQKKALRDAAQIQVNNIVSSLKLYKLHMNTFPSTEQGLAALVERPGGLKDPSRWNGSYLDSSTVPDDPWDNPYQYELVDPDKVLVYSIGPDGKGGSEDDIKSK